MKAFVVSSILLVVLFSASGLADEDEADTSLELLTRGDRKRRFVGGEYTVITLFPHHVSIEFDSNTMCAGAIISDHFVLTAAICQVYLGKKTMVRAGSFERGTGGTLHEMERFLPHRDYTSARKDGHDIAVVQVKEAFKNNNFQKPIEMFHADEEVRSGSMVHITGYGSGAYQLQHIDVPVAQCDNKDASISPDTFCAGYFEKNICMGDTGSPVTNGSRLVGIVSHESNCGNKPGIITKVAPYQDWIQYIIHTSKLF